ATTLIPSVCSPVIDILYPTLKISDVERNNIAFSSFPDSASFDTGSELHSFRIPDSMIPGHPPRTAFYMAMYSSTNGEIRHQNVRSLFCLPTCRTRRSFYRSSLNWLRCTSPRVLLL
ncbi:hypothetical protein BS47DRAFT_1356386, partial [Hydnum rufescens UP504]